MKVILKGIPQCQWNIDGHYKPGGTIVELTDSEIKKHTDVVLVIIDKPKEVKAKEYTKEELKEKSFSELRKIGKKFKLKGRGSKELIREILEAQK